MESGAPGAASRATELGAWEMIGRMRGMRPGFFQHGDLYDLEISTKLPIRLAFAGLWCWTDREGRFEWKPRELKLNILPYDDVDFSAILDALASAGFVVPYEVKGRRFGWVPTFTKHQNINPREAASELPEPPADIAGHATDAAMLGGFHIYKKGGDGFVYLALARKAWLIKIGFAERDPQQRVDALSCGSPEPLELVDAIKVPRSKENELHQALAPHRVHGEWYAITPESLAILAASFTEASRVLDASATREGRVTAEVKGSELKGTEEDQQHGGLGAAGAQIEPEPTEAAAAPSEPTLSEIVVSAAKPAPLPAIIGKRTFVAVRDRLASVSAEIMEGTRLRLRKADLRILQAELVFGYWVAKTGHEKSIFDPKRERLLIKHLDANGGDVSEMLYTIDGSLKDDHLQGRKPDSDRKYDGIETIFRDRGQVERLAGLMKAYRESKPHRMVEKYADIMNAGGSDEAK
jgi:Meiotically up-regulated gene 113